MSTLRIIFLREGQATPLPDLKSALRMREEEADGFLWLDLLSPTPAALEPLSLAFGLHPLAVEDAISPEHRGKLKEYQNHLFLLLNCLGPEDAPDRLLETRELDIFVGTRYLLSVHQRAIPAVEEVYGRWEKGAPAGRGSVDFLLHDLCETVTESYFPVLDEMDERVDNLEDQLLSGRTELEIVQGLTRLRREAVSLRRVLGQQREALATLARRETPWLSPQSALYRLDVHDHALRLVELLETYREVIAAAFEVYRSHIAHRQNEVMKTLTVIATIMLPLSIITGYFGMNFVVLPLLENPVGVWIATGLMVAVAAAMVLYFRLRGWY